MYLLFKHGANMLDVDENKNNILMYACKIGNDIIVHRVLLDLKFYGIDINYTDNNGMNALRLVHKRGACKVY